jgi:hypothetical protein
MLRNTFFVILLGCMSLSVIANDAIDFLKDTPASQYDIGRIQASRAADALSLQFNGERIEGTKFKVKGFDSTNDLETIGLIGEFVGRSKYLSLDSCKNVKSKFNLSENRLEKIFWPDFTDEELNLIKGIVVFSVELIAEENADFRISC